MDDPLLVLQESEDLVAYVFFLVDILSVLVPVAYVRSHALATVTDHQFTTLSKGLEHPLLSCCGFDVRHRLSFAIRL
jgi:hypothetical protein